MWHKRCTGPAHDEPVYLPASDKYFYTRKESSKRYGQFVSQCRLCCNWARLQSPGSISGRVPVRDALPFYLEAISRVGLMELSKRTELNYTGLMRIPNGEAKYVLKSNLRKVMLELISMRRKNEYSINRQARWRNERRLLSPHPTCAGCGTPQSNYTEGCTTCWERRRGISRRAA